MCQFLQQFSAVHALHAAICMTDDHYFLHAKLNDGHQKTADHTSVWMRDHTAGIFNDLRITVFQAECRRKQFGQTEMCIRDSAYSVFKDNPKAVLFFCLFLCLQQFPDQTVFRHRLFQICLLYTSAILSI